MSAGPDTELAVRLVGVGKRYRKGRGRSRLGEVVSGVLRHPLEALRRRTAADEFWALRDVSLEIRRGEVVGFIGRNGAGKSTLLKILCRITQMTEGSAEVSGRVGSLLEVGTGFHPELTGRENVFLNGAILGMTRDAVARSFDEIVAFADVEAFLDTPVKHYSSGMYMRLAFAVAAHLEPEVLVIDEVLAVGDAAFQRKCLGKMSDVAKGGRTVLFVSHNMPVVQRLCTRAHLLDGGRIVESGEPGAVIDAYHRVNGGVEDGSGTRVIPADQVGFVGWEVSGTAASTGSRHATWCGDPCTLRFRLQVPRPVPQATFGLALWSRDGLLVWAMRSVDADGAVRLEPGSYEISFAAPSLPLRPDAYQVLVSVNEDNEGPLDGWYATPSLHVLPKNETGLPPHWQGVMQLPGTFDLRRVTTEKEGTG